MSDSDAPQLDQIGWFSLEPHDFGLILKDAVYRIEFRQFPESIDVAEVLVQNGIIRAADPGLQNAVGRSLSECLAIWRTHFPQMTMKRTLLRAPDEGDVQYWIIHDIPVEVVLYTATDIIRDPLHQHMMPDQEYKLYIAATVNRDPDEDSSYEGQIWTDKAEPGDSITARDMWHRMYQHLYKALSDESTPIPQVGETPTPVLTVNTGGVISTFASDSSLLNRWLTYYSPSENAAVFYSMADNRFGFMTPATARRYLHILRHCEWPLRMGRHP